MVQKFINMFVLGSLMVIFGILQNIAKDPVIIIIATVLCAISYIAFMIYVWSTDFERRSDGT